jgi:hypothetical protein
MASKRETEDKIRTILRRVYNDKIKDNTLGVTPDEVNFDKETFPILSKFENLRQTIINLLTKQYEDFISDIWWVAPRPTTFKIILANNQHFYLIYGEKSWIAKVEGKKYYLTNISEEENAAEAISRILMYGTGGGEKEEVSGEVPTGGETPSDETIPEVPSETPAEETPPAEEETPEETLPA